MNGTVQTRPFGWLRLAFVWAPLALALIGLRADALTLPPHVIQHRDMDPTGTGIVANPDISPAEQAKLNLITSPQTYGPGPVICSGSSNTLLYPLNQGTWTYVQFFEDGHGAISGPATGPGLGERNDDDSATVVLPFTFDLYGDTYGPGHASPDDVCYVNQNGNLSFHEPFSTFSSVAFPTGQFKMVAPFWGDVDTRGNATSLAGDTWQQLVDSNGDGFIDTLVVTWDNVGYYNQQQDRRNSFQVAISDGTNPVMGIGNNVCFSYDNMCWTTGSASGGVGGFGGTPATVGANRGNGTDFFQIGRFNQNNGNYDGPGGSDDGVDYLDGQHFCFSTAVNSSNICPIPANFPPGNQVTVTVPATLNLNLQFLSPETFQTTSVTFTDPDGAQANGLVINTSSGNPATATLNWPTECGDAGTYVINFAATDNFVTPCTTNVDLTIIVVCPNQPPICDAGGPYSAECGGATTSIALDGSGSSDPDNDPLTYAWTTDCPGASFDDASSATPVLTLNSSPGCSVNCTATLTVSDGIASVTCSAPVSVSDTTAPQIMCPPDVTLECGGSPPAHGACCLGVNNCTDTTAEACASQGGVFNADISCSSGICNAPECSAAACGTFVPCIANTTCVCVSLSGGGSGGVCVEGTTACAGLVPCPDGNCPPGSVCAVNTCCGVSVCVPQSVFCPGGPNPIDPPPAGTLTIRGVMEDAPPVNVTQPGPTDPENTGFATATDTCGSASVTYSDSVTEGSCPGAQTILRTWTSTDSCGNHSSCTQTITVRDTTPPVISCPADATIECDQPHDPAHLGSAAASDSCDSNPSVTYSDVTVPSNNPPVVAVIARTWTATDACGNQSSCDQTITLVDTTPPVVTCSTATSSLWPPNHNLINVGLAVSVVDNCDTNAGSSTAVAVYGDEDDEMATGDGNHSPDAKNIAAGTLRLRAERRGDADGRVYLIVVTASDASGNSASCCSTVVVTHSQSAADIASVNAQAAAAKAYYLAHGAPPPGYFVVGDGPVIGPKQ